MMRTPLGQYVDPNDISYAQVSSKDYYKNKDTGELFEDFMDSFSLMMDSHWTNAFAIEITLKNGKSSKVSKIFETQEEAQSELDKLFDPDKTNYNNISLEYIKDNNILLKKYGLDDQYTTLEHLNLDKWAVSNSGSISHHSGFKEAIEKFNSI